MFWPDQILGSIPHGTHEANPGLKMIALRKKTIIFLFLHCQLQAQGQLQAQTGVELILNNFEDFDMILG